MKRTASAYIVDELRRATEALSATYLGKLDYEFWTNRVATLREVVRILRRLPLGRAHRRVWARPLGDRR